MMRLCVLCSEELPEAMKPLLDLGEQIPANDLRAIDDIPQGDVLPLAVIDCPHCGHVQLAPESRIDGAKRYGPSYPYRSGINPDWLVHCQGLARHALRYDAGYSSQAKYVMDIGGGDGSMLEAWRSVVGPVDPARLRLVDPSGVENVDRWTLTREHFPDDTAALPLPSVHVIVAQNVLNAVLDPYRFFCGARDLLTDRGVFIVEVPWLLSIVRHLLWETVYHEHVSYWTMAGLDAIAKRAGLQLVGAAWTPIHGGSMRLTFARPTAIPVDDSVGVMREAERHAGVLPGGGWEAGHDGTARVAFSTSMPEHIHHAGVWTRALLDSYSDPLWLVGAAAKTSVAVQTLGLVDRFPMCVDDTPTKQGGLLAGRISIVPHDVMDGHYVPAALCIPFNCVDAIRRVWKPAGDPPVLRWREL